MRLSEKRILKKLRRLSAVALFAAGAFVCAGEIDAEQIVSGVIADEIEVPSIHSEIDAAQADVTSSGGMDVRKVRRGIKSETPLDGSGLPSNFDAREAGFVTPVKEQNDNTCWTYSAVSVAESDLLARNVAIGGGAQIDGSLDLSEDHLAYFFYHTPQDEMGNTEGDKNIALTDYLLAGGNHIFTTFGLANWVGLAGEGVKADWEREDLNFSDFPNDVHLQNAYWINLCEDSDEVKRMILEHGSAAISIYYSGAYLNQASYYNPGVTLVNHAVAVVGWDDNYGRENFGRTPKGDGAWLVKNSFGTTFGDGGYFWISYEDAALKSSSAKAFVFAFEDAGNYDHIYQYDGSAGAYMDGETKDTGSRVKSRDAIANVFTVPSGIKTRYQTLEAVSFALFDVNVDYSIQIYKNPVDSSNPSDGVPLLAGAAEGRTSYVGYYTVPLPEKLLLTAGDTFSVVIQLSKESGEEISFFVDKTYTNGNWISFVNQISAGESFMSENGVWRDLAEDGVTARVKAFTSDYVLPAERVSLSQNALEIDVGESVQLTASVLPEGTSYTQILWNSSDASAVEVSEEGVVRGIRAGNAVIMAKCAAAPDVFDTCTVKVVRRKKSGAKPNESTEHGSESDSETEEETLNEQPQLGRQPDKAEIKTDSEKTVRASQKPLTGDESNPEAWILIGMFAMLIAAGTGKKIKY